MPRRITFVIATAFAAVPIAMAAPLALPTLTQPTLGQVQLAAQGEHLCETRLFGKKARPWLKAEKPVKYQWSNRSARTAELRGDTIYIQANPTATLPNVVIGKDAKGNMTITGNWKFKTNIRDGVVFTCKAG